LYNLNKHNPKYWTEAGVTPQEAYKMVYSVWEDFFVDKIRYYVTTGQIKKPANCEDVKDVAPGIQVRVSERDIISDIIDAVLGQ